MSLTNALYRALLRPAAAMRRSSQPSVVLWPTVQPTAWGQFEKAKKNNDVCGLQLLAMPNDLTEFLRACSVALPPSPASNGAEIYRY